MNAPTPLTVAPENLTAAREYLQAQLDAQFKKLGEFQEQVAKDPTYAIEWRAEVAVSSQEFIRRGSLLASYLNRDPENMRREDLDESASQYLREILSWRPDSSTSPWANACSVAKSDGFRAYTRTYIAVMQLLVPGWTHPLTAMRYA